MRTINLYVAKLRTSIIFPKFNTDHARLIYAILYITLPLCFSPGALTSIPVSVPDLGDIKLSLCVISSKFITLDVVQKVIFIRMGRIRSNSRICHIVSKREVIAGFFGSWGGGGDRLQRTLSRS